MMMIEIIIIIAIIVIKILIVILHMFHVAKFTMPSNDSLRWPFGRPGEISGTNHANRDAPSIGQTPRLWSCYVSYLFN